MSYRLQVPPEVRVGGAVIRKLLQVGLGTEVDTPVRCEIFPGCERRCGTHAEACGERLLGDEVREHPEDGSTLAWFTQTQGRELVSGTQRRLVALVEDNVSPCCR